LHPKLKELLDGGVSGGFGIDAEDGFGAGPRSISQELSWGWPKAKADRKLFSYPASKSIVFA
jgi:hypothetical protein